MARVAVVVPTIPGRETDFTSAASRRTPTPPERPHLHRVRARLMRGGVDRRR